MSSLSPAPILPKQDLDFPLCSMREKYIGEKSNVVGIIIGWGEIHQHIKPTKKKVNILYMNAQRAAQYEFSYNAEMHRWERNGKALPEGAYSFVLTKDWKMLGFNDADERLFTQMLKAHGVTEKIIFKHSTLTDGNDVLFGGSSTLKDNQFTWDEQSGHYRPKPIHVAACKIWQRTHGVEGAIYHKYTKVKSESKEKLSHHC